MKFFSTIVGATFLAGMIACGVIDSDTGSFGLDSLDELSEAEFEVKADAKNCGRGGKRGGGRMMLRNLDLDEEQQEKITSLRDQMHTDLQAIREEIEAKREEMRELWNTDQPDRQAILDKHTEMDPLRQEIREGRIDFRLAVLGILTEEQREELAEMVSERGRCGPRE